MQFKFASSRQLQSATVAKRRDAVRQAFIRSWSSYKQHAWLHDELRPVSGGHKDPFGGWAATLVDSLDTLWIMDLKDEFYAAADQAAKIDWNKTSETAVNLFETTIRHLGGLLSAYDLSGEPALLSKAQELGDMLYMAFDTPNRLPGFWLSFEDALSGAQVAGYVPPLFSFCREHHLLILTLLLNRRTNDLAPSRRPSRSSSPGSHSLPITTNISMRLTVFGHTSNAHRRNPTCLACGLH